MPTTLSAGQQPLPGFELKRLLGRGGFGEVWLAIAPGGKEIAIKFVSLQGKEGFKELRALNFVKQINHPNLLPIFAFWVRDAKGQLRDGSSYAAANKEENAAAAPTELIIAMGRGDKSLHDCLAATPRGIPPSELIGYFEDAARAIDFLNRPIHDLGEGPVAIQHCDIKPQNIMLVGDAAQVCDFGLARALRTDMRTTLAAASPAYGAPECLGQGNPSPTTDQYSLAISYFELRTGSLPFAANETLLGVIECHLKGKLKLNRLPPAERRVIQRATSVDPKARYPTTLAMVRALRAALSGQAPPELELARDELAHPATGASGPEQQSRQTPAVRGHLATMTLDSGGASETTAFKQEPTRGTTPEQPKPGWQQAAPRSRALKYAAAAILLVAVAVGGAIAWPRLQNAATGSSSVAANSAQASATDEQRPQEEAAEPVPAKLTDALSQLDAQPQDALAVAKDVLSSPAAAALSPIRKREWTLLEARAVARLERWDELEAALQQLDKLPEEGNAAGQTARQHIEQILRMLALIVRTNAPTDDALVDQLIALKRQESSVEPGSPWARYEEDAKLLTKHSAPRLEEYRHQSLGASETLASATSAAARLAELSGAAHDQQTADFLGAAERELAAFENPQASRRELFTAMQYLQNNRDALAQVCAELGKHEWTLARSAIQQWSSRHLAAREAPAKNDPTSEAFYPLAITLDLAGALTRLAFAEWLLDTRVDKYAVRPANIKQARQLIDENTTPAQLESLDPAGRLYADYVRAELAIAQASDPATWHTAGKQLHALLNQSATNAISADRRANAVSWLWQAAGHQARASTSPHLAEILAPAFSAETAADVLAWSSTAERVSHELSLSPPGNALWIRATAARCADPPDWAVAKASSESWLKSYNAPPADRLKMLQIAAVAQPQDAAGTVAALGYLSELYDRAGGLQPTDEGRSIDDPELCRGLYEFVVQPAIARLTADSAQGLPETIRPTQAKFWFAAGNLLQDPAVKFEGTGENARLVAVLNAFQQAASLEPENASYQVALAAARLQFPPAQITPEQLLAAESQARGALDKLPDSAAARDAVARALWFRSLQVLDSAERFAMIEEAVTLARAAIKLGKEHHHDPRLQAYYHITASAASTVLGNFAPCQQQRAMALHEARDLAVAALQIQQPSHRDWIFEAQGNALEDLAWIAREKPAENYTAAEQAFASAWQVAEDAQYHVDWARCRYKSVADGGLQRDLRPALHELETALAMHPGLAEGQRWLGHIQYRLGDRAAGDAAFRTSIKLADEHGQPFDAAVFRRKWAAEIADDALRSGNAEVRRRARDLLQSTQDGPAQAGVPVEILAFYRAKLLAEGNADKRPALAALEACWNSDLKQAEPQHFDLLIMAVGYLDNVAVAARDTDPAAAARHGARALTIARRAQELAKGDDGHQFYAGQTIGDAIYAELAWTPRSSPQFTARAHAALQAYLDAYPWAEKLESCNPIEERPVIDMGQYLLNLVRILNPDKSTPGLSPAEKQGCQKFLKFAEQVMQRATADNRVALSRVVNEIRGRL